MDRLGWAGARAARRWGAHVELLRREGEDRQACRACHSHCTMGSPIGLPQMSRNLRPASPAVAATCGASCGQKVFEVQGFERETGRANGSCRVKGATGEQRRQAKEAARGQELARMAFYGSASLCCAPHRVPLVVKDVGMLLLQGGKKGGRDGAHVRSSLPARIGNSSNCANATCGGKGGHTRMS